MTLTTLTTLSVQIKYPILLIIFPQWILIFTSCGNHMTHQEMVQSIVSGYISRLKAKRKIW